MFGIEAFDFFRGCLALSSEAFAWEFEYAQAFGGVDLIESLEACVLFGKTAAFRHVHDL